MWDTRRRGEHTCVRIFIERLFFFIQLSFQKLACKRKRDDSEGKIVDEAGKEGVTRSPTRASNEVMAEYCGVGKVKMASTGTGEAFRKVCSTDIEAACCSTWTWSTAEWNSTCTAFPSLFVCNDIRFLSFQSKLWMDLLFASFCTRWVNCLFTEVITGGIRPEDKDLRNGLTSLKTLRREGP